MSANKIEKSQKTLNQYGYNINKNAIVIDFILKSPILIPRILFEILKDKFKVNKR